jgi:phosphatidylglycerophosphatase A
VGIVTKDRMTTERPLHDQTSIDRPSIVSPKSQQQKRSRWAFLIATFCGIGYLKPGPGTWASMATVLLWWLAARAFHLGPHGTWLLLAVGIAFSLIAGIPAADVAARESGREDPGFVVIDEVAGQCIALLGCPTDWAHALVCLALFRLFDITKPYPIRKLEDLPGGWGIVFDDVAAGLYAFGVAALVRIWY